MVPYYKFPWCRARLIEVVVVMFRYAAIVGRAMRLTARSFPRIVVARFSFLVRNLWNVLPQAALAELVGEAVANVQIPFIPRNLP